MQTHDFFGRVQHLAALPSFDEAARATRATLQTLAERVGPDEAGHLVAQLPDGVGHWLRSRPGPVGLSSDDFLRRVSEREGIDLPVSVHHARCVLSVLRDAVSAGEIDDVLERLPHDFQRLFAGAQGRMPPS